MINKVNKLKWWTNLSDTDRYYFKILTVDEKTLNEIKELEEARLKWRIKKG